MAFDGTQIWALTTFGRTQNDSALIRITSLTPLAYRVYDATRGSDVVTIALHGGQLHGGEGRRWFETGSSSIERARLYRFNGSGWSSVGSTESRAVNWIGSLCNGLVIAVKDKDRLYFWPAGEPRPIEVAARDDEGSQYDIRGFGSVFTSLRKGTLKTGYYWDYYWGRTYKRPGSGDAGTGAYVYSVIPRVELCNQ